MTEQLYNIHILNDAELNNINHITKEINCKKWNTCVVVFF